MKAARLAAAPLALSLALAISFPPAIQTAAAQTGAKVPLPPRPIPAPRPAPQPKPAQPAESKPATENLTIDPDTYFPRYFRIIGYPEIPAPKLSFTGPPPAPGQKLIDWSKPPIIDYEIPEKWRGMKIACAEPSPSLMQEAAATCEPILKLAKLRIRLEFAVEDAREYRTKDPARAKASYEEAQTYADAILKPQPSLDYPLQYSIASDAYGFLGSLYAKFDQTDKAIAMQDARIALLSGGEKYSSVSTSSTFAGDFSSSTELASAYSTKSALLLAKKDRTAAEQNYNQSLQAAKPKDHYVMFSPLRGHTEMMVKDAIFARDYSKALSWTDAYFDAYNLEADVYGAIGDFTAQIQLQKLLSYKLYIFADQGKKAELLETLGDYEKTVEGRASERCSIIDLFPQVVAPYHKDAGIRARLNALGCDDAFLTRLDSVPEKGVIFSGKTPELPPHQ